LSKFKWIVQGPLIFLKFEASMLQNVAGIFLAGGFNHREKYESQWEGLSHILWKIKNV